MKKNYINGLDGIRAIAIIGVTLFHIYPSIVKGGYLGVSLFLVLTGFLLAQTSKKEFNVINYYGKRIKRIYPPLIIVILTTCAFLFIFSRSSLSGSKAEIISIFAGYNNWWQISQNADYFTRISNASPFTHLWYMGIEMQFYLIWPLLYLFYKVPKNKRIPVVSFFILALASGLLMFFMYNPQNDVTRIYYGTDTRIHAILIGIALGFIYSQKRYKTSTFTSMLVCIVTLLLLVFTGILYFLLDGQNVILYRGGMFFITILFAILIMIVANPNFIIGKLFENPVYKWIGKHSFSIYLWQYPVIYIISTLKLANIPYITVVEIILILILAVLLDTFLDRMNHIKDNKIMLIPTLCLALIIGLGAYGVATSTNEKQEGIEELQKQLEENAEKMQEQQPTEPEYVSLDHVVLIGDSVLLDAYDAVMEAIPECTIDAQVSRFCGEEFPILQSLYDQGILKDTVVIALGTNGNLYDYLVYQTLDWLGPNYNVFWVNCYCPYESWEATNNEFLRQIDAQYPNVHIIDWYSVAAAHPEYLSVDGVHPDYEGNIAYANLIKEAIETTEKVNS